MEMFMFSTMKGKIYLALMFFEMSEKCPLSIQGSWWEKCNSTVLCMGSVDFFHLQKVLVMVWGSHPDISA